MRRRRILDRVIAHLYYQAQRARGRSEHELWTITLRLVSMARAGQEPSLDYAAYMAVGRNFEGWRAGVRERDAMMAAELARLVPDYDPTMEQASRVRRPEAFSGNLYEMPAPPEPPEREPLRKVPRAAAAQER